MKALGVFGGLWLGAMPGLTETPVATGAMLGAIVAGVFIGGKVGRFGWALLACTFVGAFAGAGWWNLSGANEAMRAGRLSELQMTAYGAVLGVIAGVPTGVVAEWLLPSRK